MHIGSSVLPGTRIKYCDPIYLDDVTVDFNSGRVSIFTTVTSGVSVRVAKILPIMMMRSRAPIELPIMIFLLRLNAIPVISSLT